MNISSDFNYLDYFRLQIHSKAPGSRLCPLLLARIFFKVLQIIGTNEVNYVVNVKKK